MEYVVHPDVVTTAKGIAGGLPFGAILFSEKTEKTLGYGEHGTTFGGNPISAAAAYSVISRIDDKLLAHVREARSLIEKKLTGAKNIVSVSGKGLMVGIGLKEGIPAAEVVSKGIEAGVIALTAKTKVRLLPPLNISFEDLEKGLDILIDIISKY